MTDAERCGGREEKQIRCEIIIGSGWRWTDTERRITKPREARKTRRDRSREKGEDGRPEREDKEGAKTQTSTKENITA